MANALIAVCSNKEFRMRLAKAGLRLVRERADQEQCMDSLEAIYGRLIDEQTLERKGET